MVPDIAGTANNLTEEKVTDKCFELIFAFDEVITAGGYRENVNLQQIRTNLEMDSHEEKLHNMIKVSKMDNARDQAKDAAKIIREKNREIGRQGISGGMSNTDDSYERDTYRPTKTGMINFVQYFFISFYIFNFRYNDGCLQRFYSNSYSCNHHTHSCCSEEGNVTLQQIFEEQIT